jgi:hypothetical protein
VDPDVTAEVLFRTSRSGVSQHALGADVEYLDDAVRIGGDARGLTLLKCALQGQRASAELLLLASSPAPSERGVAYVRAESPARCGRELPWCEAIEGASMAC